MKSPHGQPSPALLSSIHRPYPRDNAKDTGGDPIIMRPEIRRSPRFPSSAATKRLIAESGESHHALLDRLLDLTDI
jgi:hypothetical protein